ncbi:DUF6126 family protein [Streptomyces sp. ME01-24h]|nr:DUF6126 family protein [Streptomyces sp. ME19-03-3]MDX3357977.1 DUF6126 family protein [Streptomyces sp. ME01-24h]
MTGPRQDRGSDRYKQRAVLLRVLVYVFVTHFIAGFITLLFYLGRHAPK